MGGGAERRYPAAVSESSGEINKAIHTIPSSTDAEQSSMMIVSSNEGRSFQIRMFSPMTFPCHRTVDSLRAFWGPGPGTIACEACEWKYKLRFGLFSVKIDPWRSSGLHGS